MEKGLIDIGVLLEPIDIEKFDFIRLNIEEVKYERLAGEIIICLLLICVGYSF